MSADKFSLAKFTKETLRADANVFVFINKQAKLIREIKVGLVVRCGRQKNHSTVVCHDILGYRPISLSVAIAEIMTLVD